MKYFFIEPEVAGKLGENTVLDPAVYPARVDKLNYKFSGWLGDAMLESFPCVIATQAASDALKQSDVTGGSSWRLRFQHLMSSVSCTRIVSSLPSSG
ncbi:hypothetical protein [Ralstonia pseudosolanacearum]|uniref:hypothetical protein n=1 Tax=Ralstonia pseudosolanacearum TaxID=1310165 RepID=UPI0020C77308|nr:hypothetical protein [Ralstonia pseudosolanacearum]